MADHGLARLVAARLAELAIERDTLEPYANAVRDHAPEHAAALEGHANAIGCSLAELLVLDGGLAASLSGAELERSLGLYIDSPAGPILAGAWSLEPEAAALVSLHADPPTGAWHFGVPAGLPLAGIAASGFAILANHLRPALTRPTLPGAVRLRQLLAQSRSQDARARIDDPSLAIADGRNWMVADAASFHGFEQLGDARILTRIGRKVGHVHANHCFDPSLRQREARPRSAKSFRRLELASTLYVQRRPTSAESVLELFAEIEREAFPSIRDRAQCWLAIELATGRALWQRESAGPPQSQSFASPLTPASNHSP